QGLGMFFGFRLAFGGNLPFTAWMARKEWISAPVSLPNTATIGDTTYGVPPSGELLEAIKQANAGTEAPNFIEQMLGMFNKGYPDGIDPALISSTMIEWKLYWFFPAGMALVILVIFSAAFWDKVKTDDVTQTDAAEAVQEEKLV